MFKNYFKIALRNLVKHKIYSIINISGLALGLACSILILLWVWDELSYDNFFNDAEQIYRVNWDFKWNENEGVGPGTPPPLAAAVKNEIPGVEATTRIYPVSRMAVRYENKFFNEDKIFAADSNLFNFFNYRFLAGNPNLALLKPNSVVLTEQAAHKHFGEKPAIGKIISIGKEKQSFNKTYHNLFEVTGVIENPASNSHIQFDMMTSISSHPEVEFFDWSWVWMQVVTYAKLDKNVSPGIVESKIPAIVKKYAPTAFARIGFSYEDLIKSGGKWDFVLQPMRNIYLKSRETGNRLGPSGDMKYIYLFSIIAVFVLTLACINFMNLSTAYSSGRTKEISIRKVLGSEKRMLIGQFLTESFIFSFFSMLLALFIVELTLPFFNNLAGKSLQFGFMKSESLFLSLVLLTLFVGLIAGSYPAFYLASFKPIEVLKRKFDSGRGNLKFRNILVVFQFAITVTLIICTLLVYKQMNFVNNTDLGFDKDGVVIINNENNVLGDGTEAFIEKLKNNSSVINAAVSTGVPPDYGFQDYYKVEGKGDAQFDLISYMVDENFIGTMGIKVEEGRNFSKDFSTDSESILLNESAVRYFGLTNPIGKIINYPSKGDYKIIGVIKDFNFASLHSPITPFALFHTSSKSYQIPQSFIVVRIPLNDFQESIRIIHKEWDSFVPGSPFEYKFLNESFEQAYLSDQRLGKIFFVFSFLTIFIACIGLFGLVSFSSKQRTKEIGVRKVLGASVSSIVGLLIKNFLALVLAANIIACPVAYYFMNMWLENFAYRINVGFLPFVIAGFTALLIAVATVIFQAIKAATANPVESLRYE